MNATMRFIAAFILFIAYETTQYLSVVRHTKARLYGIQPRGL